MRMCLNWKVLAGLGVVAAGVLLLRPGLLGTVLPTLLVLACPLSMLAMMVGMGKMGTMQGDPCALPARSQAALSRSRDEQVVTLRRQLADLEAQRRTLAEQLRDLEQAEPAARRPLATGAGSREQRAR